MAHPTVRHPSLDDDAVAFKETYMKQRLWLVSCAALAACSTSNDVTVGSAGPAESAAASGSASVASSAAAPNLPAWIGIPPPGANDVLSTINKSGREPYAGKTGTLKGRIWMKGDRAPVTDWTFPAGGCAQAPAVYGKAFRTGQDDTLADALVMVAGYDAFVPPAKPAVTVRAEACAFETRTVAMTFGQRLEVLNGDPTGSYTPFLDGSDYRAIMLAVPDGEAVKLYPQRPAINYVLRDFQNRNFMEADVLVLKFATLDVTGLDGRYEIDRIPVGKVSVDVYLPVLDKHEIKDIEIKEGENTLDLTLTYDKEKDKVVQRPKGPFARGTDQSREGAAPGKFGAPPIPQDVPH